MCLKVMDVPAVPEETARVARMVFSQGNRYVTLRDKLGSIYNDNHFERLFDRRGQPGESAWRLMLISIFQFMEDLSDRQAADAVRARIDWKYALSLPLEDTGFHHSVLSEFRGRLLAGGAETVVFEQLLKCFKTQGWLKARGYQRTDSTHVLGAIRALNRLECVGETLRHALNVLAVVDPDWLRSHSHPDWRERYERRIDDYRLPKTDQARITYAEVIGADGKMLLDMLNSPQAPQWLKQIPAVELLKIVWEQNYREAEDKLRWRSSEEIPPAHEFIGSPYDSQAHYSKKQTTSWVGYRVHLTETCDENSPHLITNVETTSGPIADGEATPAVHAALARRSLLPAIHVVDTGYLDAELLLSSQQDYQVDLLGPTRSDKHWQFRAGQGFDASHFHIDWEHHSATCPTGQTSKSWSPSIDNRHNRVIRIKFSLKDCGPCPVHTLCTRAKRRSISIRPDGQYQALQSARERQQTEGFRLEYARRAGIEGTLSQAIRACGMRRSRYIGEAKTHLQHLLTAAAINLIRVANWLLGEEPAQTRHSSFARLWTPSTT